MASRPDEHDWRSKDKNAWPIYYFCYYNTSVNLSARSAELQFFIRQATRSEPLDF